MSNPFGNKSFGSNPFGGTTGTFGTQGNTSSNASLFGQSTQASTGAFGSPTSTSGQQTSTFGGIAGTQVTSAFSQPRPLFGSVQTSPFGQSSLFGQSSSTVASSASTAVSQSSPSLFQQSSGSAFQTATSTGFGQSGGFSFGTAMSTNSKPVFGQTFAVSGSSTSQTSPASSSTFSQPTSASGSGFGLKQISSHGPQTSSAFGTTVGLFGKPGQQSSIVSTGSTSTASQFSSGRSETSQNTSGASGLFGKPTAADSGGPSLFGKTVSTTSSLFGKPSSTSGQFSLASSASKSDPFSKSAFGIKSEKAEPGIPFGSDHSRTSQTESNKLFGGDKSENIYTRAELQSTSTSQSTKRMNLFGKSSHPSQDVETGSKGLFGKDVKRGGHSAREDTNDDQESKQTQRPGLFGKALAGATGQSRTTQDRSEGSDGRTRVSRGLFGKPLPRAGENEQEKEREIKPPLRRQISDDIANKVAVICKNVPSRFNTVQHLRRHFERFGPVTKVYPNSTKQQATIHFKTHEAALEAKRRGRNLTKDAPPMTIFWSSYSLPRSAGKTQSEKDQRPSKSVKRLSDSSNDPMPKKRTWKATDNVDDELASMSGTQDTEYKQEGTRPAIKVKVDKKPSRTVSPTTTISADMKGDRISLASFEGVRSITTTDRVQLLVLRDKYFRQNQAKRKTDIAKAKAFAGTCTDMCPEKERYDREDKRRLGVYEWIPGTENIPGKNPQVDHTRAVKEYIRSSPDQDEPLPHELRPLPVLQQTMTYLLREVASRGEDGRWADWFDFLWNRTRGIRKDITQQQLCNQGAADLIEKCARFHIFCSERLCEEDMHSFDAKINNENMTKCLQTLKEFYADLEKKQKIYCENETEFRAYMVLMNLNEGDILREVQKLRPEVRTSQPVQFALQTYYSLSNNNYIRFFRLVKQASYSHACIMHRYFTQVRNRALQSMMKGYSMGKTPAQIPLSELVRLLGFESEDEAGYFCQHYGFTVRDGEAVLDRAEYIEPETAWEARRAVNLIESKLQLSVGEFINGGVFNESFEILNPRSSFDRNGVFHSVVPLPKRGQVEHTPPAQSVTSVKQEGSVSPVKISRVETPAATAPDLPQPAVPVEVKQEVAPPKPVITNEAIKEMAKILFWEVINEMVQDLGQEVMSDVQAKLKLAHSYTDFELREIIREEMESVCREVYLEEQAQKQLELKRELEERRDRVASVLTSELINDLLNQEALNLATIQMREVKAQLKKESIERVTVEINQDLVSEVATSMILEVAEDVFETDVTQRIKQMEEFEKIIKLSRTARYLEMWKKEYKAVTKLKRAMQEFPSATNMENFGAQVRQLVNVEDESVRDGQFYVNKRALVSVETPLEVLKRRRLIETQITVHSLYQNLLRHTAWQPLDLTRIISRHLREQSRRQAATSGCLLPSTLLWKLLISLPEIEGGPDMDSVTTRNLCNWLTVKFTRGATPTGHQSDKSKAISVYKCQIGARGFGQASREPTHLGICVRTVTGTLSVDDVQETQEEHLFLGTSGIMFLLPAGAPLEDPDDEYWSDNSERLRKVLKVKPTHQELPLVVIVPVPANQEVCESQLSDYLQLADYLEEGHLGDVNYVMLNTDPAHCQGIDVINPRVSESVCEGIQWLGKRTSPAPGLGVTYLRDCVEGAILEHYHTPIQQNLKQRRVLGHLEKDPFSLLALYNSVVQHLAATLTSDTLAAVSWPVPEFGHTAIGTPPSHWNSEDHFEYLYKLLLSLQLPELRVQNPDSEAWQDVQTDLWTYMKSVVSSGEHPAKVNLFSRLRKLLHQVELDFEDTCFLTEGVDQCEPSYINVPWTKVISLCIDYRLNTLNFCDPDLISSQDDPEPCEMKIAYDPEALGSFSVPQDWKHIESDTSIIKAPSLDETIHAAVYKREEEISQSKCKKEVMIVDVPENTSVLSVETKKSSSHLISSLQSERRCSDHFQKYLETALLEGEDDMAKPNMTGSQMDVNMSFDPSTSMFLNPGNQRRLSFDATGYFGQAQNDLSHIFDPVGQDSFLNQSSRRLSLQNDSRQQSLLELSTLTGKQRRARLSEIFGNDPVMMCLKEPTLMEDLESLKEGLKSSRRESDQFDKRLQSLLLDSLKS